MEDIGISSIYGANQRRLNDNKGTKSDAIVQGYLGINTNRFTYTSKPL
jgi:hypothetical protein